VLIAEVARDYATDPNYAALVNAITRQTNVVQAMGVARRHEPMDPSA
jgi:flagellum-specific peptidoglycan hydrolase FlgJ